MKTSFFSNALVFIALLGFSSLHAVPDKPPTPKGVTAVEWSGIRGAHEAWKHRFTGSPDGTYSANNTAQQWRTVFDGRGFLVEPSGQTWKWGLELKGYGIGDSRIPVSGNAEIDMVDHRLSYRWDENLEEWFLNDGRGLEQGWTLQIRPTGKGADNSALRLDLAVRGDLQPVVDASGQSVNFVSGNGITTLTYGGLKAWDAAGRALPTRFISRTAGITVEVDDHNATYPVTIDPVAQQAFLKASNPGGSDLFGVSVAVSGDTVVVGAQNEDSANGDQADNTGSNVGAAYVFVRDEEGNWSQQAYLKSSNPDDTDHFGRAVAVSGDTVVIGAWGEESNATGVNGNQADDSEGNAGAVYIFTRIEGSWSQQAYLKASNTEAEKRFGWSVAISDDTVVVGTYGSAPNSGAAYVFFRNEEDTWSEQAYLQATNPTEGDFFGHSVAVSGDTMVAGAHGEASNAGAAYVFSRSGTIWSFQDYLQASNAGADDRFGWAVGVSDDIVVVGAYGESSNAGAAYVFYRSDVEWNEEAYLKASPLGSNDRFGHSVAVSSDTVVVGAIYEDNGGSDAGAAYVFSRNGVIWSQQAYLKANNAGSSDQFGYSVAISGDTVVAGAYGEESYAGAAYVFTTQPTASTPPTLTLSGKAKITTSKSRVALKGTAADADGDLSRVEVRDSRPRGEKTFRPAQGTAQWKFNVPLKPGRNKIQIRAVDAQGNMSAIKTATILQKKKRRR